MAAVDQLLLLESSADLPEIDRTRPRFEYSGERFKRDHPELHALAVSMLAERVPVRRIADLLHASQNTIRAVAIAERVPIDAQRQIILDGAMFAQRLAVDRITERLQAEALPSLKDSAVAFGILTQNVQLLSGGATVRLERMESSEDIYSGFERLHARLVESLRNGLVPGNPPANAAVGDLGAGSLAGPVIDAESEAFPSDSDDRAADSAADSGETAADTAALESVGTRRTEGGEGVEFSAGREVNIIDKPSSDFVDKGKGES